MSMLATLKAVFRKAPSHQAAASRVAAPVTSQGAKAQLARLLRDEQAALRQIEALLIRRSDLAADASAAHLAGRKAGGTLMVITVIDDQLALQRDTLAQLEARIARLHLRGSGPPCKIIDLMQAASLLRAVPQ